MSSGVPPVGLLCHGLERDPVQIAVQLVPVRTQSGTAGYFGGLNLGCGKSMTPGTFWSGLIDDVRVYNRAVKP